MALSSSAFTQSFTKSTFQTISESSRRAQMHKKILVLGPMTPLMCNPIQVSAKFEICSHKTRSMKKKKGSDVITYPCQPQHRAFSFRLGVFPHHPRFPKAKQFVSQVVHTHSYSHTHTHIIFLQAISHSQEQLSFILFPLRIAFISFLRCLPPLFL